MKIQSAQFVQLDDLMDELEKIAPFFRISDERMDKFLENWDNVNCWCLVNPRAFIYQYAKFHFNELSFAKFVNSKEGRVVWDMLGHGTIFVDIA
jgi:hypothetical protein